MIENISVLYVVTKIYWHNNEFSNFNCLTKIISSPLISNFLIITC